MTGFRPLFHSLMAASIAGSILIGRIAAAGAAPARSAQQVNQDASWWDRLTSDQKQQLMLSTAEYQKAIEHFKRNEPQAAIEPMKKCIELAESVLGKDYGALAGKHADLGAILEAIGRYEEAANCYRESLRINEAGLPSGHPLIALNRTTFGRCLILAGKPREAGPVLLSTGAEVEKAHGADSLESAEFQITLGSFYDAIKDYAEAEKCYRKSVEKLRARPDCPPASKATALNNLGRVLTNNRDFAGARVCLDESLDVSRKAFGENHRLTAIVLESLGSLLLWQADPSGALDYANQSLAIRRTILPPGHPDIGFALSNRARIQIDKGEYQAAMIDLAESTEILVKALGKTHPSVATVMHLAGQCYYDTGDFVKSREWTLRALDIRKAAYGSGSPEVGLTLYDLGVVSTREGAFTPAELYISEAIQCVEGVWGKQYSRAAMMYEGRGMVRAAQGKAAKALADFDASQRSLREHARTVLPALSPNDQQMYRNMLAVRIRNGLAYAYETRSDRDAVAKSAEWILNNKAMVHEALALQVQLQQLQRDDPRAKELVQLRQELSALAMTTPLPGEERLHAEKIKSLQEKESALARRLAAETGITQVGDAWHDLSGVRKQISGDAVLVEFARVMPRSVKPGDRFGRPEVERYMAWVIASAGDVHLVDLGTADETDRLIESIRRQIDSDGRKSSNHDTFDEAEVTRAVNARLQQLAERIYWPLADKVGRPKELILSPDGNLWLVPWASLPVNKEQELLIEQSAIRFLTSGRDLDRRGKQSQGEVGPPLLFVHPKFDLPPEGVQRSLAAMELEPASTARSGNRRFESVEELPVSEEETRQLSEDLDKFAHAKPVVYMRDRALETVAKCAKRPQVLFFHTHGFFLEDETRSSGADAIMGFGDPLSGHPSTHDAPMENPFLRCGLLLSGCNNSGVQFGEDGYLTGQEVLTMDLRGTRLVVLSACSTGVGKIGNGEGVAGLRQAFQMAVAEAVVATLWSVDSRETGMLMKLFFKNLAQGQPGPEALRSAQLSRIKARRDLYDGGAHPYFWSAVTYTGGSSTDRQTPQTSP